MSVIIVFLMESKFLILLILGEWSKCVITRHMWICPHALENCRVKEQHVLRPNIQGVQGTQKARHQRIK